MSRELQLKGVYTALISPFRNGKLDEQAFINLIERQIKAGVSGIVPCGTTGESPTLNYEEHLRLIEIAIEIANKKIKVIAGAGSNSTNEAIMFSQKAEKLGADAVMLVSPYYNKPNQHGLYAHFKAVNDAISTPIILYNSPSRTGVDISDETVAKLSELENIVGIKDATGNLERPARLRVKLKKEFYQLSGDDGVALAFNAQGGVGIISVSSNIVPELCVKLQNLFAEGKIQEAINLNDQLMPLHMAMFCETNPVPVKYAASCLGICSPELRLPLVELQENNKKHIEEVLRSLKLINN